VRAASAICVVLLALPLAGCGAKEPDSRTLRLEIPKSASASSGRGDPPSGIPRSMEARVGDKLVVVNHSDSLRFVAGFPVRAGKTVTIPLSSAGRFSTSCSVHDKRPTSLIVRER
jgi:hypothetical protein